MAWSTPYTLLIVGLVAAPSLVARSVHVVTGDPLWQYLAIDEQRLATTETEFDADGPHLRIRVYWRGPDEAYQTPDALVGALRASFDTKGVEAFIAVMDAAPTPAHPETTVDFRAGNNLFGPFPVWDVARHVQPAVRAAHLNHTPSVPELFRW